MKIGFVYAGQGSQHVGMGKDFYDTYHLFRETIDNADVQVNKVTKFDLRKCCFEGPTDMLSNTIYTQPCMAAYAVGVTKLLFDRKIRPEYVCGLSLGEYSALFASGALDENTVFDLIAYRGKVMAEASAGRNVKMPAILHTDRETVAEGLEEARQSLENETENVVEIANYNCPGQIVISGDAKAVDKASEILTAKGAKRIIPLQVSGPFHTSLMKKAGDELYEKLRTVTFGWMNSKVIFNATGKTLSESGKDKDGTDMNIQRLLRKQVQSSVYLEDSIKLMAEKGVDTIIEIGPSHTLSKFLKRISPDIKIYSIDLVEDFEGCVAELTKESKQSAAS